MKADAFHSHPSPLTIHVLPFMGGIALKHVLILGAGISGLGAAHVLLRHGTHVVISDLKDQIQNTKEKEELIGLGLSSASASSLRVFWTGWMPSSFPLSSRRKMS